MNLSTSSSVTPFTPRTVVTFQRTELPAHIKGLSLVNLAARQRMLSQRMILQTMLAANGSDTSLQLDTIDMLVKSSIE